MDYLLKWDCSGRTYESKFSGFLLRISTCRLGFFWGVLLPGGDVVAVGMEKSWDAAEKKIVRAVNKATTDGMQAFSVRDKNESSKSVGSV